MDCEKSDTLTAETWQLPDYQIVILFLDYITNELYGNEVFNRAVENGLNKMKTAREGK